MRPRAARAADPIDIHDQARTMGTVADKFVLYTQPG
jgi:hypothetical protein